MKDKKQGSSLGKQIGCFIVTLLISPLLIVGSILALLYTPIDYLRYRLSAYGRQTRQRYTWLVTSSTSYRLYRAMTNAELPIDFDIDTENGSKGGFFSYKGTLIVHCLDTGAVFFDEDNNKWHAYADGRELLTDDLIRSELSRAERLLGKRFDNAVILIDRASFDTEELFHAAEQSGSFIICGKRSVGDCLSEFVGERAAQEDI